MPKVWIISQARMTSSRLPGKILLHAGDKTLLQHHIDRLKKFSPNIIIATTINESDQPVVDFCISNNLKVVRGSEEDVLGRFALAIDRYIAPEDLVVRVTSDCPLIDADLIQKGVDLYLSKNDVHAYVSNCFPRTYARGFDFEIVQAAQLKEASQMTVDPFDREHVTPYFWKNKSGHAVLYNIDQPSDHSQLRICVDTQDDFDLVKKLIEDHQCARMEYQSIETLLLKHPELVQINAHIEQKKN